MKIRYGFVPNSSSSSFIVRVWSHLYLKKGRKLSKEMEQKLAKFGFKQTNMVNPDQFDYQDTQCNLKQDKLIPKINYNYGYAVSCNQDDVIEFLVKHRIAFRASVHYGHYTYVYDGEETIYSFPNYGLIFHRDSKEDMEKAVGKLILQERGIERLHITQFMSKADKDRWYKEQQKKWKKMRGKQ